MSQTRRTPRWVKVSGIIVIIMVLLFGILHITGNSFGGHIPTHTPTTELGLQQP